MGYWKGAWIDLKEGLGAIADGEDPNKIKKLKKLQGDDYVPPAPKFKSTSHFLHFCLSAISFGFWIPIWIVCTLMNNQANRRNGL